MAEHDYVIDNQSAPAFRADLNNALQAIVSQNSKETEPTTTYANMMWYDTATNWLFLRNEVDTAWIRFAYFNQSTNKISLVDDTSIVNTSGTQTGLLGDQSTATWQSGAGTTQSLVSPANVKAAVLALAPSSVPTTAQVGAATAGLAVGAVGSYAFLAVNSANDEVIRLPGSTLAGTALYYANANRSGNVPPSGTWRLMGMISLVSTADPVNTSLWLRIS